MRRKHSIIATIAATLTLTALAVADFAVTWSSIDGGAGTSAGTTFSVTGTIGQPDAETLSSETWGLDGGYVPGGPPSSPPCPADLDGSTDVGFGDLLIILSSWGPCTPPCEADLDNSGDVGFGDLLIVLAAWGACP